MLKLEEFEHLKLYRSKFNLIKSKNNKGVMLLLNTNNRTECLNIINNNNIGFRNYYHSYFVDFMYRFKCFEKAIVDKLDTSAIYDDIKRNSKFITRTFRNLSQYKGNNVYIDLYHYNELFNEASRGKRGFIYYKHYLNMLDHIIEKYNSDIYDNKYMVFDLSNSDLNFRIPKTYAPNSIETPIQAIFYLIQQDINYVNNLPFDILIRNNNQTILIKSKEVSKDTSHKLRGLFNKLNTKEEYRMYMNESEEKVDNVAYKIKSDIGLSYISTSYSFNGKLVDEDLDNMIQEKVEKILEEAEENGEDISEEEAEAKVRAELNKDEEFLSKLQLVTNDSITNMSNQSTKRNKMLAEKQAKIQINKTGKTIEQILDEAKNSKITPLKLKLETLNDDMKELSFPNFSKEYNERYKDKDTIGIFNAFKELRNPVYIIDIKRENTSTEFDKKETWTITMESSDRLRHTVKVDMPIFVDDSFLYLGGNKKNIINQLFLLPISKTGPDTVQACSNYNKIFMTRTGTRLSPKVERFKKALDVYKGGNTRSKVYFKNGDNSTVNGAFKTNIEYDELSYKYMNIYCNGGKYVFYFNQDYLRSDLKNKNIKLDESDDNMLPVGIKDNKEVIYLNTDTNIIKGSNEQLVDYISSCISEGISDFKTQMSSFTVGKRFVYTQCTIMSTKIPLILLLAYLEGLTTVMKKADIKCTFSDTRPILNDYDKNNKDIIQFADGYLIYDRYPYSNSLLLNGLSIVPTKEFNYADLDNKETYLTIFDNLYNNRMILNAFENFYDLFIDKPITYEVCQQLNLPTEFVDLLIYANRLLEDNQYTLENKMNLYRLRNNEIVNAVLYKNLADAYSRYRTTAGNKHPEKISVPRDCVIKDIVMLNTVEDYSTLNPVLEAEKLRAVSFKGLSGLNVDRAYTLEKRAYDSTMKGIVAMSSPPTGSVGLVRQLAFDVNVKSIRGYLHLAENEDELTSTNMFCPSELLTPFCAQMDDSPRVAMTTTQTKHIVPCKNYNPLLISNGADKALSHIISNDFAYKAKQDGVVLEADYDNGIIMVKYKDGKVDAVPVGDAVYKNGGGGFYINNSLISSLKKGDKIKEGDILTYNKNFFERDANQDTTYKAGCLAKIAIASGFYTYEDSDMITQKLSDDLTTEIIMKQDVVLGPNSNIEYIVKEGQHLEVGDPLLSFDESYEDDTINKLLASLDNNAAKEKLINTGKVPIKAKHAGEICEIKIYYTVDKESLSPSLRKTINNINAKIENKKKLINKYTNVNETNIILEPTQKVETKYGKVKGVDVGEGVLIEFYIKHPVKSGVGDKIIFFNALKSVTCKVLDKGIEPFSEYRPDEEVSAFLSPISFLARMTDSILINGWTNKVLIELKRHMEELYNE